MRPSPAFDYGALVRAQDGCIVTFELPDGNFHVERFYQLIHTTGTRKRTRHTSGKAVVEQAAGRADELGARIVTISTPTTILRDLQGTRGLMRAKRTGKIGISGGMDSYVADRIDIPERVMLGRIGRLDLLEPFDA